MYLVSCGIVWSSWLKKNRDHDDDHEDDDVYYHYDYMIIVNIILR